MLLESAAAEAASAIEAIHAIEHVFAIPDEHPADVLIVLLQVGTVVLQLAVVAEIGIVAVATVVPDQAESAVMPMFEREAVGTVPALQKLIPGRPFRLDDLRVAPRHT
jgi:hypothetical protein